MKNVMASVVKTMKENLVEAFAMMGKGNGYYGR